MANGNNATIGFEKQIWDAACVLWGHIPAAEYRKVIVGLIFLRYISNAFEKRYQELVAEGDGFEDDRDAYAEDNIFFVPEDARWSKIASSAHTPEIGTLIDNAMRAIEAENKSLKNVLPKNYASPDLDKRVLGDVVDLFTNMDMSDTKENKDLLGKTYDINRMDSGSAIPSTDRYEIYSIDVDLPDLVTQRRVVSVLELLDNKIQDNNKINDNLAVLKFDGGYIQFAGHQFGQKRIPQHR